MSIYSLYSLYIVYIYIYRRLYGLLGIHIRKSLILSLFRHKLFCKSSHKLYKYQIIYTIALTIYKIHILLKDGLHF
nr:MAG TPA: hypothetical protein [Siphoviridae sp. ctV7v5]DAN14247.1 MAG TPA: hypothetical protein [Bacteriophage sp.]